MGTKNNPGEFDCYAAAAPDEPMFILLARDPLAPILVDLWAMLRADSGCSEHPGRSHSKKVLEAHECAESMRNWRAESLRADKPR
jgi:hypothetical protein